MALKKYKGAVIQPPLDWYARIAQSAQQWFSSSTTAYWAFTLRNNANDGSSLWVYDVAVSSGPQFPTGTGNPGGNPNAPAGSSGATPGVASTVAVTAITQAAGNSVNSILITRPGTPLAGQVIILVLSCNADPALFSPPDATWTLLGNNSNNLAGMGLGVYGHVCTAAEPANYTCTLSGAASLFSGQMYLCSGVQSPGYLDQIAFTNPQSANANFSFPAVTNTAAGDLVIIGVGDFILNEVWTVPAGFTGMTIVTNTVTSYRAWWLGGAALGTIGPFAGQAAHTVVQDTFTLTLKPNVTAIAPAQNLSAPIMTQTPLGPGLLNLQFSSNPLGLSGVTKFLPPACDYRWSRDAPIAIIGPGLNLNLAGITPENAAWCDLTWLALRA
jgi:hypothetical protein